MFNAEIIDMVKQYDYINCLNLLMEPFMMLLQRRLTKPEHGVLVALAMSSSNLIMVTDNCIMKLFGNDNANDQNITVLYHGMNTNTVLQMIEYANTSQSHYDEIIKMISTDFRDKNIMIDMVGNVSTGFTYVVKPGEEVDLYAIGFGSCYES